MTLRWTEGKSKQLKTGDCSKSRGKVGKIRTDNVTGSQDSRDGVMCKINRSVSLDTGRQGKTIQEAEQA